MIRYTFDNWWSIALKGFFSILFGVFALFNTGLAMQTLVYYFGFLAIASGISVLVGAVSHKSENKSIYYWLIEAVIDIGIGFLIILFPEKTAEVMLLFLAVWAFFIGMMQLLYLSKVPQFKLFWAISGVLSILFSILIFNDPFDGAYALISVLGIYLIILGSMFLRISIALKNHNNPKIKE